jgi:hypothetical protein
MPWNDGIQEYWNNGFSRMRSFFDTISKSEINPPAADRLLSPIFHYSTIPSFQSGYPAKRNPGKEAFFDKRIAVANPTGFHLSVNFHTKYKQTFNTKLRLKIVTQRLLRLRRTAFHTLYSLAQTAYSLAQTAFSKCSFS